MRCDFHARVARTRLYACLYGYGQVTRVFGRLWFDRRGGEEVVGAGLV